MTILREVKRSKFYEELTDDLSKKYFNLKDKKYVHQIDTLYYSVFIKGDDNDDEYVSRLIYDVKEIKDNLFSSGEEGLDFMEGLEIMRGRHADYAHRLSVRDCYDIFIVTHIRSSSTPRILVQIRSSYIWKNGIDNALYNSFNKVKELLNFYGLEVEKTQENRIDYAYHTNCIQSPEKFFDVKSVVKTYRGSFDKGKNIFNFNRDDYSIDYLGLGSRKSNNLYFRIYDKTREVVEMNYKSFFFDIWYSEGLINFYDKYCLEYAYINGCVYEKIYEGSLQFYLEFGTNDEIKNRINKLFSSENVKFQDIKKIFKEIMPPVTRVLNFEFETKRKYYYNMNFIDFLSCNDCKDEKLSRIFKILENKKIFLNDLNTRVVRFEKDGQVMGFWKGVQRLRIKSIASEKIKIDKSTRNVDLEKLKNRALNSIASYSAYNKDSLNDDIVCDVIDLLVDLNDNDIQKNNFNLVDIETGNLVNIETGEILYCKDSKLEQEYKYKKNKKYKQIKNLKK